MPLCFHFHLYLYFVYNTHVFVCIGRYVEQLVRRSLRGVTTRLTLKPLVFNRSTSNAMRALYNVGCVGFCKTFQGSQKHKVNRSNCGVLTKEGVTRLVLMRLRSQLLKGWGDHVPITQHVDQLAVCAMYSNSLRSDKWCRGGKPTQRPVGGGVGKQEGS